MQRSDLPMLEDRLQQLADALGGRAPSAAGLLVWLDALKEVHFDDVKAALSDWPKSNVRMPAPAEILKATREATSRLIEARAAEFSKGNRAPVPAPKGDPNSPAYLAFKAAMVELKKRPRPQGKDWAWKLREREISGEELLPVQRENWRSALRGVPGAEVPDETESQREARLEREAIVAEGAQ